MAQYQPHSQPNDDDTSAQMEAVQDPLGRLDQSSPAYLQLHPDEIAAIEQIIKSYVAYLRRSASGASSSQDKVSRFIALCTRLASYRQQQSSEAALFLSCADLECICEALDGFSKLIRRHIPKTRQRDDMLLDLQRLRQALTKMLSAPPSTCLTDIFDQMWRNRNLLVST
ncbi:hypothetical protein EPA93_36470 [Ktedonosporobacter rubrisoli]|uniref:Uncharacterized protein n=1 Tax=Ktedonosporobacter rubrisoli TaxID=2509675 RepID=A0A4P6JZE3_KTERU|nr:hypothetical protein [Ktedonosporobacter rubrisoli]QBD81177.1 hypothetical protein EPA93_36470 [Ktedonosporobacter rubrisoli]